MNFSLVKILQLKSQLYTHNRTTNPRQAIISNVSGCLPVARRICIYIYLPRNHTRSVCAEKTENTTIKYITPYTIIKYHLHIPTSTITYCTGWNSLMTRRMRERLQIVVVANDKRHKIALICWLM